VTMVGVDDSSLQVDSQPKSFGLVWGLQMFWHCSTYVRWIRWTVVMTCTLSCSWLLVLWVLLY